MSRKRAREFNPKTCVENDIDCIHDDYDDAEGVVIPIIPDKKLVSKEKYASVVENYIVAISKIAQFASETYVECISPQFESQPCEKIFADEKQLTSVYEEVLGYGFIHSEKGGFTDVFICKSKKEDVQRKTSLRSHLFWEICKLRWSLQKMRSYIENMHDNRNVISQSKSLSYEQYVSELSDLNICLYPSKNTGTFTQRELDQAFFLLSACWKTIDYSLVLSKYVNLLMDRLCEFFCFSMSCDEMDDEELRQPLPLDMLPRFECLSLKQGANVKYSNHQRHDNMFVKEGGRRRRKGEEEEEEMTHAYEDGTNDTRQYAPNFDFVIMCQMRFFNFLSDLSLYEDRSKRNLKKSLKFYHSECISIKNVKKNVFSKYDSSTYLNINMLKRFVRDSCQHVSPEQKEKTASRYVFSTFSKTDYEWLVYKQPVNLPSFADEFISKACKDSEYTHVVERTRKTYAEILKDDVGDVKLTGFYEWCVLKNASRLFALHFDIFKKVVINREEVRENSVFIFNYSKPLIVQFFSRYYVFYDNYLYVDETVDPSDSNLNEKTIYDTLMLWICIMLKDFPKSKKSKHIESTLKTKYAEYFKLEEIERNARENAYKNSQRLRLQREDEEIDDNGVPMPTGSSKRGEGLDEEEDEENDGKSERQNIHDAYFEKAVNLPEEDLNNLEETERQRDGLYFF